MDTVENVSPKAVKNLYLYINPYLREVYPWVLKHFVLHNTKDNFICCYLCMYTNNYIVNFFFI